MRRIEAKGALQLFQVEETIESIKLLSWDWNSGFGGFVYSLSNWILNPRGWLGVSLVLSGCSGLKSSCSGVKRWLILMG